MAHTHVMDERDNERAVDLIESAERADPYCACGRHMIAAAEADGIWLECSSLREEHAGLAGLLARLTAFGHSRRMIMDLPH